MNEGKKKVKSIDKKKIVLLFGIVLIITSVILSILSVVFAFSIHNQRLDFLEDEDIYFESLSVRMEDGIEIKGLLYVDKDLEKEEDNSVPTVLMLHGINGRKERGIYKIYQFVKLGYAVFSIELRGHGESGGISAFFGEEPDDIIEVIDYIEDNYEFSNSTHLAIYGFSYGGGVATILQAIEDRVHVSVIYHPLASIERMTEQVPFQNLLGNTPAISNIDDIEDGFEVCTPKNTENLLLIHGENDDLILPEDSEDLYEQVNGTNRDDIGFEIRPDLMHGENEVDEGSLKYSLIWFEHFYHNQSINITNRDTEIKYLKLKDCNYPGSSIPENLIIIAAIILFFGISLLLLPTKIWPLSSEITSNLDKEIKTNERDAQDYKRMVFYRSIFYIIPAIIGGLIFAVFNPSYMYGYCLAIPIAIIILMLFIKSSKYSDWKSEWNDWYRNDLKIFLIGIPIIIIPVLFYVLIHNLNASLMTAPPIPFFTTSLFIYLSIGIGLFTMDCLLLRGWKLKHTFLLIGLRPLTLFIFYLFVPIPGFPYFGGYIVHILVISVIGIIFWIIFIFIVIFGIIFKNKIVVILILLLPVLPFLLDRFFRII